MDTSETYIKMRVAAIPNLGMGDKSFALKLPYFVTDNVWIAPNGNFYCHRNLGKEDVIIGCQLERQDQLQEMIGDFEHCVGLIDRWEAEQGLGYTYIYEQELTSMEQLWLALVMSEEYEKVWDGTNWVK